MGDEDDEPLKGDVEIDETSWGGKPRGTRPGASALTAPALEADDQSDRPGDGRARRPAALPRDLNPPWRAA